MISLNQIHQLLIHAVKSNASDIHLSNGYPPIVRINGKLQPIKGRQLTKQDLEDIIVQILEYTHTPKNCLIQQRELGQHTNTFSMALRSALREDPDVILVGEMRDLETISLALTAAETGHLVLSTLHTRTAPDTINRIIDVFPAEQQKQILAQISSSLLGIVSQRLLINASGTGRVAAAEVMIANSAIRNLIRERKVHQIRSIMQSSTTPNMQTLDEHLITLLQKGKISRETARKYAIEIERFDQEAVSSVR